MRAPFWLRTLQLRRVHDVGAGTGIAAIQRQLRRCRDRRSGWCDASASAASFRVKERYSPGCHRNGQIRHTRPLMPSREVSLLHRHIFVEGALAVGGIQLPHRGLENATVLDVQLAGADGLPEPLAALAAYPRCPTMFAAMQSSAGGHPGQGWSGWRRSRCRCPPAAPVRG